MDERILLQNGISATNSRKASLANYGLRIGQRASLLPSQDETAYGIVMSVNKEALDQLYSEASVSDYIPEKVQVTTDHKEVIDAICYNLPADTMSGTNPAYAEALLELATSLDFPPHYLRNIAKYVV